MSEAQARAIRQTILALEEQWAQVDVTNDRTVFDTIIAPDFHSTSSRTGRRRDRAEWIAQWEYKGVTVARHIDPVVDVYSADVAVYSGIDETHGRNADGSERVHQDICTDTWLRRGGKWQAVAAHCSRIR